MKAISGRLLFAFAFILSGTCLIIGQWGLMIFHNSQWKLKRTNGD